MFQSEAPSWPPKLLGSVNTHCGEVKCSRHANKCAHRGTGRRPWDGGWSREGCLEGRTGRLHFTAVGSREMDMENIESNGGRLKCVYLSAPGAGA